MTILQRIVFTYIRLIDPVNILRDIVANALDSIVIIVPVMCFQVAAVRGCGQGVI